ncbi:MAG: T9SS type A sorting domain-containing protein [Candidatus Marinimicrobia bacterium]|nr:T9SS type A sorting domain-containing protein [Candidatus Neomarinimicrobiota bacterium]
MILKHKTIDIALSFILSSAVIFGSAPELQFAGYQPDDNQLVLVFDQDVKVDNVFLGLISFDDDNSGPNTDLFLQGGQVVNPAGLVLNDTIIIHLIYQDIIDSFTGSFFGENAYLFELWGTDLDQIKTLEGMATDNLTLQLDAGAFISEDNEMCLAQAVACTVAPDNSRPVIESAVYDANINTLTLTFDSYVQYDRLAEDRSIAGGPGNGLLQNAIPGNDDGEDRNDNGALDFETNIQPFEIGLVGSAGSMTLENIGSLVQTEDSDTLDIVLTSNDAKRLEASVGLDVLNLAVNEWAFVDTNYNPNLASNASVSVISDSVDFAADSAVYDLSKNILSIYFSNMFAAGRTIGLTNPSPVYTKFNLNSAAGSYSLNGVEGNPSSLSGFNNTAFKFKLPIGDQAGVEGLLDGSALTLSVNSFALYDNYSNGNSEFSGVPVRVTENSSANEQPPILVTSNYDVEQHTLTLTWDLNLGVGFYQGDALTGLDNADEQELSGLYLYDSVADSAIVLGTGSVYYSGSKKNTYIQLSEADAITLETYANLDDLSTYIDRDVFNAFLFLNGNAAVGAVDSIRFEVVADTTAPVIVGSRLNVFTKTIEIETNEPVSYASITVADFALAGLNLNGTILNEAELNYGRQIELELDEASFNAFEALVDSVRIAPDLTVSAGAFTNISSLTSVTDTLSSAVGRTFYLRSFEAFAPGPKLRFGALKLIGESCDIYVDDEMWADGKVSQANLIEIQTAFETSTPVDSTRGIQAIVDAYYGGILDTDGNDKVVFFLADLLDEYDLGRNDTQDSFFESGFVTLQDTSDGQYSNHSDLIYLDVDPQLVGVAPYSEWDESMFNALTYQYTLLSAMTNKPEQERWINYGVALKMQEQTVGNIKFFGDGVNTKATANNELTYIAQSLLKSRGDLFNVYNYFTYLTEKFPGATDSLAIIKTIAASDVIGIAAVDAALEELGYSISAAQSYQNYAVACFLDLTQYSDSDSARYGGIYNFQALALDGAPGGKNAGNLAWDKASGSGAPFAKDLIQPWSFNFYVARSYFIDIEGNFNIVSPDLNASDTLVFDGYDGIKFMASKVLLHSGYLDPMTRDYEVVDFDLDPLTSRGQLPMTTDDLFSFRSTVPDTARGVQLLALVVAKTDYAQPPVTFDYVFTNVTSKPEFGDFYAVQNPDAENYLDLFVVSERPIYGLTGEEGAVAQINGLVDTTLVELPLLDGRDGIVSIYSGKYTLTAEGAYSLVFSGRDQNGVSLDPVTRNISIGLARRNSSLAMLLPDGSGQLSIPENAVSYSRYIVAGRLHEHESAGMGGIPDLPDGIQSVSNIYYIGHDQLRLNREATLTLSLTSNQLEQAATLGVYLLRDEHWRYLGGIVDVADQQLDVTTGQLGRFVIATGDHPQAELFIPKVFALEQNYPNPFNPSTTISFSLPRDAAVTVKVFNMLGQEVTTLVDGHYPAGMHAIQWNARNGSPAQVASGVYFYTIESADVRLVKKMVLLK